MFNILVIIINLRQNSVPVFRVEEPLAAASVEEDEADLIKNQEEFELPTTEDGVPEIQSSFRPASWRLGVRMESARDSERYLHRILH